MVSCEKHATCMSLINVLDVISSSMVVPTVKDDELDHLCEHMFSQLKDIMHIYHFLTSKVETTVKLYNVTIV